MAETTADLILPRHGVAIKREKAQIAWANGLRVWGRKRGCVSASETINDAGLVRVVRGHLDFDAVTDDEADEAFAHFAGNMGEHFVGVREFYPEHGASQNGGDGAFEFDGGFLVFDFILAAPDGVSAGIGTTVAGITAWTVLESFFGRRHDR